MMLAPREQVVVGVRTAQDRRSAARANPDSRRDRRRQQTAMRTRRPIAAAQVLVLSPDAAVRDDIARVLLAVNANFQIETADPAKYLAPCERIRREREAARTGSDARLLPARGQGGVHAAHLSAASREEHAVRGRNRNLRRWNDCERGHSQRCDGRIARDRIRDAGRDANCRDPRMDGSDCDRDRSRPFVDPAGRDRTRARAVPSAYSHSTCAIIFCSRPIISTRWC